MVLGALESFLQQSFLSRAYHRAFGLPHFGTRVRFSHIKKLIIPKKHQKILDVGCGAGLYLNYFAYTARCLGVGLDHLSSMIAKANAVSSKFNLNNKFVVGCIDDDAYIIQRDCFDCVLITEVLEHITDPERLIRQCVLGIVPGGRIIISAPVIPRKRWIFSSVDSSFSYGKDRHIVDGFDETELTCMIERAGGVIDSRHETFGPVGQTCWEISEKIRRFKMLYYALLPAFLLLARLDVCFPSGLHSGVILSIRSNV